VKLDAVGVSVAWIMIPVSTDVVVDFYLIFRNGIASVNVPKTLSGATTGVKIEISSVIISK
jgi:hypothetical protein